MLAGRAVEVLRRVEGAPDSMGEPSVSWDAETVGNVLMQPTSDDGMGDGERPLGTVDVVTFHFPKDYAASLATCRIAFEGNVYDVLGDPVGYMPELTPGPWNRAVKAKRADG